MIFREFRDLYRYHSVNSARFGRHDVLNVFQKNLEVLVRHGFGRAKGKDVLDIGCGQRYPLALQFAARGANVTALDIDYVRPDPIPIRFLQTCRHNGLRRAVKSLVRGLVFDPIYYSALRKNSGIDLLQFRSEISFVTADPEAGRYPLPDNSFDLIVSNAVVEHIRDVEGFAAEIDRLLVPGGYFTAIIHNFYSISGGHQMDWAFPDENPSRRVPPWDHLRNNEYPAWVHLNKLLPHEYEAAFSKYLAIIHFEGVDINHDVGGTEGEGLLTADIREELKNLPLRLLLTRAWHLVGQSAKENERGS